MAAKQVARSRARHTQKRKNWSQTSMIEAIKAVKRGMTLRDASSSYVVPVETLRRRVIGAVAVDCRPGPKTIMTDTEEMMLCEYIVNMADMGYGLSREDIMRVAFQIVEKMKRPHPFKDGAAGKSWLQGFLSRHKLSVRSPQPLSHARARSVTDEVIKDFFTKLGGIFARLNLLYKPMQVYNIDETSINVVHRPGKVVAEIGHRKVWSVTSAERGKTHTVLTCVNASGQSIPPLIIFPRKRMKEDLKEGAMPGTMFCCSESGWINQQLFLEWFKFFIESIPPARPVLIIEDGHASHVSLDVIKLAKENDVHLLCLPSHSTHILQPLDVGVFKSLKAHFNKECRDFLHSNPGQKIRSENLASLLSLAWPKALTPINVMKGFKQCGIYPLNPGVISDRLLAPSKVFSPEPREISDRDKTPDIANISDFSDILSLPKASSVSNMSLKSFNSDGARCITDESFITEITEEAIRKEEEKKRKEEEKKRKEEEKKRKEEEKKRKEEEKKRKEEEKKRKDDEKRQKQEERKRKAEEKKKIQEERKQLREEEKRKKAEDKRRKEREREDRQRQKGLEREKKEAKKREKERKEEELRSTSKSTKERETCSSCSNT